MLARHVILFLTVLIISVQAIASDAVANITFERRSWTPIDGAPSGAWEIAQTTDGLLWFASPSGLYRYDGEKFLQVETVYGHKILSHNLSEVRALKRGIALTYQFGRMSLFTPDGVKHYGVDAGLPTGVLRSPLEAPNGELYVGTSDGLARLNGDKWELMHDVGLPRNSADQNYIDSDGTFWVSIEGTLYARPKDSQKFSLYMRDLAKWKMMLVIRGKLHAILTNGDVITLRFGEKPTVVFGKLSTDFDTLLEGPDSTTLAWFDDNRGLVQLVRHHDGRYRIGDALRVGSLEKSSLLSSFNDREGNTWITSLNGVERLRAQRIHDIRVPGVVFLPYVHKGLGDSILMAGVSSPQILNLTAPEATPLNLANVVAMWRDGADSLWAGSGFGLHHITSSGIKTWPLPQKLLSWQTIQAIAVDREGTVWVSITKYGLYRFSNGNWQHIDTRVLGTDGTPVIMHVDGAGRIWLGFTGGRIAELRDGNVHPHLTPASVDIGTVLSLIDIDGHLIAGGENGLVWLAPKGAQAMQPEQIKVFRGIAGLVVDKQGDLWAHGISGIYRITRGELAKFWADPGRRLKWQILSLADGVRGNATQIRPLPSLTIANDGKIYYATNSQVAWFDPLNLRKNAVAPQVMVLGIRAGASQLEPKSSMTIQAGTTTLEIKYAVTALSVPEKVKIKYQLSGVDHEWQEPTGERVARYTNLEPGDYTFRVIAANEDGVWNDDGVRFNFSILPEFWQTTWFRLMVLAALLAIIIAFHRWRLIAAAARSAERTAARLDERERIARTLHDNLLQGIHALILRSSTILNRLPKGSQEERILESVLGQAEKLVEDTRDEVMALRDSQPAEQIVAALCKELEALAPSIKGRLKLAISPEVERVRPDVARELCQVLKEAISNAARHSGAREINASLMVTGGRIDGAVLDDGVGMQPNIAENGAPGHWGIVGMRERISRLGGTLIIEKNGQQGTALRFTVSLADGLI